MPPATKMFGPTAGCEPNAAAAGDTAAAAAGETSLAPYPITKAGWEIELKRDVSASLVVGADMALISRKWFSKFTQDPTPSRPHSPIDNASLLLDDGLCSLGDMGEPKLRRCMAENHDYNIVSVELFMMLKAAFGGGPLITRKVIQKPGQLVVEVYPWCLQVLLRYPKSVESRHDITISQVATVANLRAALCHEHGLDAGCFRVYRTLTTSLGVKDALLNNDSWSLTESHVYDKGTIVVEAWREADGDEWPSTTPTALSSPPLLLTNGTAKTTYSYSYGYSEDTVETSGAAAGAQGQAGLQNLGNTCFMNSALQALVHTVPLTTYFLTKQHEADVNETNPLGLRGELARSYASLLTHLWVPGAVTVAPRAFKAKLGSFAPQFTGYNQHDSQELLAFLLDGLHEDLNRVKQKPYIEAKDAAGRPDAEVAAEAWASHAARNASVIVDTFQAAYKSTLVCPTCGATSVTFDPYMYLSLQLPGALSTTLRVTLVWGDGRARPMTVAVRVLKAATAADVMASVRDVAGLPPPNCVGLLLAEAECYALPRGVMSPEDAVGSLASESDTFMCYAYPTAELDAAGSPPRLCALMHRKQLHNYSYPGGPGKLFGAPLVVPVPVDMPTANMPQYLRGALLRALTPLRLPAVDGGAAAAPMDCDGEAAAPPFTMERCNLRGAKLYSYGLDAGRDASVLEIWPSERDCLPVAVDWRPTALESDYGPNALETADTHPSAAPGAPDGSTVSLADCLAGFCKQEPLGPDDMWYCPQCKEFRQAYKKLDLWTLPEVLVVHLKRFSYSRTWRDKLDTRVSFPLRGLDLSPYVINPTRQPTSSCYDLFAVSNHFGGLGGGHYTAYARQGADWLQFDDSHVTPIDESVVRCQEGGAYVLFYQRRKKEVMDL